MKNTLRAFMGAALVCGIGASAAADDSIPSSRNIPDEQVMGTVQFETFQPLTDTHLRYPEHINRNAQIENVHKIGPGVQIDASPAAQDSIRLLINRFYFNQFRSFNDPMSPYFMFISKGAKMAMGIGGIIKVKGWFDWNSPMPAQDFNIYNIPMHRDPGNNKLLAANLGGTGIFFTIIGRNDKVGDYMGYIEATFDDYNPNVFKLQKAYLTIQDWTVGYATSTFSDPSAQPPMVDGSGPNGKIDRRNVLVRWLHHHKGGHWGYAASLEFPTSKPDIDNVYTKKVADYTPDVAAFVQYKWLDGLSHVRLSGLMRLIPYRDLLTQKNHNVFGWGLQVSSVFKVAPPVTIYALAQVGQGNQSYTADLSKGNFDLVAKSDDPGHLYAPTCLGITLGARYNIRPDLSIGCALAQMRYYPSKPHPDNDLYKYGLLGAVNAFWNVTQRLQIGLEYDCGKRVNFDGHSGNANRLISSVQLSF